MLHVAYQNQHIEPGVLMGYRTRNELIPEGERAFIMGSNLYALEKRETPVTANFFMSNKEGS